MVEEDKIKKYISNIKEIIKSGDPKYVSYISKEYMNSRQNNPLVAKIIEDTIRLEAEENGSIYSIFIDDGNRIDLEAMSDISKITNVADFIKNVDALAKQNVDFGDLTSDELIIEGMEIAEEIAREIENYEIPEDDLDKDVESDLENKIESKSNNALSNFIAIGTVSAAFLTVIQKVKSRVKSTIGKAKEKINNRRLRNKESKEETKDESKSGNVDVKKVEPENDFIPKVEIDERAVIRQMDERKGSLPKEVMMQRKPNDKVSDNDNFGDDSGSDDNNTAPEDDEPDI